jgi:hypothetical protein
MTTTRTADDALAPVLISRWESASKKFVDLADAVPEAKLDVELVTGARTCSGLLRHVAYWNRYVADSLNGRKADDSANELFRKDYPGKNQILAELNKGNQEIANGISRTLNAKSIELIAMALEHVCEHYGQMVIYARLVGIVPPASSK